MRRRYSQVRLALAVALALVAVLLALLLEVLLGEERLTIKEDTQQQQTATDTVSIMVQHASESA
jgi:hypothetical protein